MIARGFADGIVRQFEPKMLHYIQTFCDRLYSCVAQHDLCNQVPWGPAMDMSHWFDYLTFDTMTEYIFGKKPNMLAKRKNQKLMLIFERLLDLGGILFYLPLPYPEKLIAILLKFVNQRQDFSQHISQRMLRLAGASPRRRHFLSSGDFARCAFWENVEPRGTAVRMPHIIHCRYDKTSISNTYEQTHTRLGYDTLSTALAATMFYLSRYQHAYMRLSNELQTAFGSIEEIRPGEKLKACHYLNASITEDLQITPPVTMCLSQEVEETGEVIDGQFLPGV